MGLHVTRPIRLVLIIRIVTVLAYTPPHPAEFLNAIAGLEGIGAPAKMHPGKFLIVEILTEHSFLIVQADP